MTCVVNEDFSVSEHDTELLTPEISAAKVAMELSDGDDVASELTKLEIDEILLITTT